MRDTNELNIYDGIIQLKFGVVHHSNMSVKCRPPYTLILYSKMGINRGIHYFLIFAMNH